MALLPRTNRWSVVRTGELWLLARLMQRILWHRRDSAATSPPPELCVKSKRNLAGGTCLWSQR